jgi:multicomponent Na+:H+ antiporter subunit G
VEIADKIGVVLIATGAAWMFLGVLGLFRFPDVYTRLHGAGLSSTAGITMILLGVTAYFSTRHVTVSVLSGLTLFLVLLGSPLTTTAIGWMAHRTQTPAHKGQVKDELREHDAEQEKATGEGAQRAVAGQGEGGWREEAEG